MCTCIFAYFSFCIIDRRVRLSQFAFSSQSRIRLVVMASLSKRQCLFFGSRSKVPRTLFSVLEHRFLQDMHLYRAAVFHKKNRHATQGRVAKRCLQPEKSTTIFNNIYNTNRHPLSNEERKRNMFFAADIFSVKFWFFEAIKISSSQSCVNRFPLCNQKTLATAYHLCMVSIYL